MTVTAKLSASLTATFETIEDVLVFAASTSTEYFNLVWGQIFGETPDENQFEIYRAKLHILPDVMNRTLCSNGETLTTVLLRKMQ